MVYIFINLNASIEFKGPNFLIDFFFIAFVFSLPLFFFHCLSSMNNR